MSCSKPLPPFVCDSLYYFNRVQLERFSIVCRPLKNFIERYFHSRPYRIFDRLCIRGGSYALFHKDVQWHPNRDDYSVLEFLAHQKCSSDKHKDPRYNFEYYPFAKMLPYFGLSIRINAVNIFVIGDSTCNAEHIAEMESIAYIWRDGDINIWNARDDNRSVDRRMVGEDFQPILNSPTILQCRVLYMRNAHFAFQEYKVLYGVKVFELVYISHEENDPDYCQQFLEQPGVKPVVVLYNLCRENVDNLLDQLSKSFSSAAVPNAFKIVFVQDNDPLTEFRETNKTSDEILELKKGLPAEYKQEWLNAFYSYTLERSSA